MARRRPGEHNLAMAALMLMAASWGSTFFMIKDIQTRIPSPDMMATRWLIAALVLSLALGRQVLRDRITLIRGAVVGLVYGLAQVVQNGGLDHTAASVSGFITGLYVVITPLILAVVLRNKLSRLTWIAVALATTGLGILSLRGLAFGIGEAATLLSAALYAVHIVLMGRWSTPASTPTLTVVQAWVTCVVCAGFAIPGGITIPASTTDWGIIFYLAVIAGAMTVFLQTWAQSRVDPTRAAVVMSAEPVWAAFFAVLLGGEGVTWRMLVGGGAIVAAMYLIEIGPRLFARRTVRARPR